MGALVVLAFVFGSLLAILALLIAAMSILTTFLLVLGLTTATDVSFIVQFLVSLIGLGAAHRHRARGGPGSDRCRRSSRNGIVVT